jgi:hypothetical protein
MKGRRLRRAALVLALAGMVQVGAAGPGRRGGRQAPRQERPTETCAKSNVAISAVPGMGERRYPEPRPY